MALLERESSLEALLRYAAEARRGEGRLVLLTGEAGVGKSVLVETLQDEVPDARWAWGACDGISTPPPLAPLTDIAESVGGRLLELVDARAHRDDLFRALLHVATDDSDVLTVLVIEDVHWADEATLDLLRFVGRRIRTATALVLLTYRSNSHAPGSSLRTALGELAALRWSRHLPLEPLSNAAVEELTAGTALDASEVFGLTGGNPFYIAEMVAAGTRGVPLSARDAVLARAAELGPEASRVLETAALAGARIEPTVLTAAARCSPEVLDELVESGLLVFDGQLRFRHEIARLAVDEQVPAHRRGAAHAALLRSLESAGGGTPSRLAFHAEGAGDMPALLRHSTRAARQAAELGSHREASAQYERALLAAEDADAPTVAGLLAGLAVESALGDRWQVAADADERALPMWRALGARREEAEALRRYSLAMKNLCRGDEGLALALQAVRLLEPLGEGPQLASAYSTLATVRMVRNESADAVELARRAQNLGKRGGAIAVVADALNTEGCALVTWDPGWREPIRRSLELSLSHNLQAEAGRAYHNLYAMLVDQRRFSEAEQYYEDAVAYCDEHDLTTHTFCLRSARTRALELLGGWDEALASSRRLLEDPTTSPLTRIGPLTRVGTIGARRGDPDAGEALEAALAAVSSTKQPQSIVQVHLARAEASWLAGMTDVARREAEQAADVARGLDLWVTGALQSWLRRLGSTREVAGVVAEPYALQQAGAHQEAARTWDRIGCCYDAALALVDADDEPSLREALHRLDDLGATATAGLVRLRMRQLGARSIPVGPRRSTRANPGGLTTREHEVLELLGDHLTNTDIARALFISPKTVEHHVSAVLAKLEVADREAAVSSARRLGLVAADAG